MLHNIEVEDPHFLMKPNTWEVQTHANSKMETEYNPSITIKKGKKKKEKPMSINENR